MLVFIFCHSLTSFGWLISLMRYWYFLLLCTLPFIEKQFMVCLSLKMSIIGLTLLTVAHSWFLTSTLCNVERIATVAITSFPDPRAGCEMVTNQIWTKVSAHKCGDCMFSGHTVLFVICACVWTTYPPCNQRIARIVISTIIWLLVLAGSAIVIMNRYVYSLGLWYMTNTI